MFQTWQSIRATLQPACRAPSSTFMYWTLVVRERAFQYFHLRSQQCSALERGDIARKTADIMSIVSHMHSISKTKTLLTAKNLRLVKKRLERVELLFNSAGLMTPRDPHR